MIEHRSPLSLHQALDAVTHQAFLPELRHLLHHPPHFLVAFEQLVDFLDAGAGARGDTLLARRLDQLGRSEEHTSELQSLMRISYAVFCLKKKNSRNVQN